MPSSQPCFGNQATLTQALSSISSTHLAHGDGAGDFDSSHNVSKLSIDLGGATQLLKHLTALLGIAPAVGDGEQAGVKDVCSVA